MVINTRLIIVMQALTAQTVALAKTYQAVCCFVDDDVNAEVLQQLAAYGIRLVVLRCTGFNNVDIDAAKKNNVWVMRVSSYSPYSVARIFSGNDVDA